MVREARDSLPLDVEVCISALLRGSKEEHTIIAVYLEHLNKTVQLKLHNSIEAGQTLRMREMGRVSPDGRKGDVFIRVMHVEYEHTPYENKTSQRNIYYEGEIHKCPNCGDIIDAYETVCEACGFEIRGRKTTSVVYELSSKLERTNDPLKKSEMIRTFYIPNTREDILEFMILASSNIDCEKDEAAAWLAKLKQAYEKAKIAYTNEDDLKRVESIYNKALSTYNKKKTVETAKGMGNGILSVFKGVGRGVKSGCSKFWAKYKESSSFRVLVYVALGVIAFLTFISLMVCYVEIPHQEHNEKMESLVLEVGELIEEGNYIKARTKAELVVGDGYSDEDDKKWNNTRKELIKQIDEAELEAKKLAVLDAWQQKWKD